MTNPKNDYLGSQLQNGDIFLIPAGSPRYGGLRFDIGIIVSQTEKRLKTITTKLKTDKARSFKLSSRTGAKILKVDDTSIYKLDVVDELRKRMIEILNLE
jgi:hypothetical protein